MTLTCEVGRERIKAEIDPKLKQHDPFDVWLGGPKVYGDKTLKISLDSDPLIEVMSLVRNGYEPFQIYNIMYDSDNVASVKITDEDRETAERVRRHFQHKYLMRQLQQKPVSDFQKTVLNILEAPAVIYGNEIQPLVKLHAFYVEDKATEKILKNAYSIADVGQPLVVDGPATFAGSVERRAKNDKITRYFWRTENNYLLKADIATDAPDNQAWKIASKVDEIYVRGDIFTLHLHGYDFVVADLKRSKFEILD